MDVVVSEQQPPGLAIDGRQVEQEQAFDAGVADDIALLLHTSGTTSRPKQVPLLQRNLMASARTIAAHYALGPGDVSYVAMPLFHVHGLVASVFGAFAAGGSAVVPRRFSPQRFWAQARDHGVTWFSAGPTLHQMILDKQAAEVAPPTLRFTRSCSSAMSPASDAAPRGRVRRAAARGVRDDGGEPSDGVEPAAAAAARARLGRACRPGPRSASWTGRERCPGRRSGRGRHPRCRCDARLSEQPEANAEAFRDGWFRTGDRGVLEDGYLRLQGRIKEMILRGGENISPYEIEDVLLAHPAVTDAVCFGVADEKYGEEVAAAVVVSGAADERGLREYCRERLAAFKVPKTIRIVDEIPRTPTGKLQRRRVAALLDEADR